MLELRTEAYVAMVVLGLAASACGSSDDTFVTAGGGSGGAKDGGAGTSGSGGTGGNAGSAGASGGASSTDAGADGAAGSAGSSGASGAAGSAGSGTGGSGGSSGSAGSGGSNTGGSGGASDAGTDAPSCPDSTGTEPNGNEKNATKTDSVNDCDEVKSTSGVLGFFPDEDWYTYLGTGGLLSCSPNPKVKLDTNKLRVCVFAQCTSGTTTLTCAKGSTATSPQGRKGCCGNGDAEAAVSCSGIGAKNADVFVRVDSPGQSACTPYTLNYSY